MQRNQCKLIKTILYILILVDIRITEGTLVLVKSTKIVLENTTLTLICSKTNDRLTVTKWKSSRFNEEALCGLLSTGCKKTEFLTTSNYDCSCNEDGTFTVYLRHVSRQQHGANWTCKELGDITSNTVAIEVAVPLTQVLIKQTGHGQVIENTTTTFKCNTSYSLPAAYISWYRSNESSTVELTSSLDRRVHITRKTYTREDNLISVEEILNFQVNRFLHDWEIFCNASNWESSQVTSERIALSVIYPPDQAPMIHDFTNGSIYEVIENTSASISCTVEGGNPLAKPKWVCMNLINNISEVVQDNTKVTSNLSWTAKRDEGKTCRCQTDHVLSNDFTFVNVDVLYPPTVLTLEVQYGNNKTNVTGDVILIENKTYSLKCSADGNPPPWKFTWSGPQNFTVSSNVSLDFSKVQSIESGTYSCVAQYIMVPTYKENKTGNMSLNVQVDILYKPTIAKLMNRDVAEGSSLNISCKVRSSNPNITDVVWTRDANDWEKHLNPLILWNISRNDSMNYTCTMKNKMIPTIGKEEEGQDNESFHLNVWYKATVMNFLVQGHEYENPVVSNETTTVRFYCDIDSNPGSITKIISPNGTELWSACSNNVSYSHVLSSCLDRGNYTCSGINKYNHGKPGNDSLSLLVNCKPMAYYHVKEEEVIRSALYVPVTLQFTAIAYPEPEFTWQIWKNSSWSIIENDTTFSISSSDMKSNLTVKNFTSTQAVQFRLLVENLMGRLNQTYTLQPLAAAVVEEIPESNTLIGLVVGSLSGVLVISVGVVFSFLWYRKRFTFKKKTETGRLLYQNIPFSSTKKSQNTKTPAKKETFFQPLQELDDTPPECNEPTEYYNSPEKIEQVEKIRVSELLQYVSDGSEDIFAAQYQKLPTGLQKPCTFARKPEHIAMNRYNGIYPYDHSRVKIPGQPDFFINACYIHGYSRQNAYIASLGPTKKVTDNYRTFWMMVWSEQSDIIIMLTNLQEPSGMKCEKYWPDFGASMMCGDIQVTCDREDVYAEYTVRSLTVSNAHGQRPVTHLHYTAWPDKKVPENVTTLIEFRERIKATPTSKKGPMVVHCSAGIGRTGTLIALDTLIEEGQCESAVDVFKCVDEMRKQRVKMVQTQEQYIYIYKALVNRLYFDCELIPVENFLEYVSTTNNNIYCKQFQQLKETVETCSKEETDARAANTALFHKNRHGADIPGCQHRIRMHLDRQLGETDYINAVYINSFKKKDHLISAQSPLPETVSDFVCMIYQENCCCVVTMEDLLEPGMAVGRYLPSGGRTLKLGRFEVTCTTLETKAQYTVREMKIKHNGQYESGEKVVYHFQYNKWVPVSDVPSDPKEFVQFIKDVRDYDDQLGEENSHVLVHCLKANERSGLYCIVAILIEKIRYERQVSILNTVRHFRTRRRTALTSMEQLKFCYKAVGAYINMSGPESCTTTMK